MSARGVSRNLDRFQGRHILGSGCSPDFLGMRPCPDSMGLGRRATVSIAVNGLLTTGALTLFTSTTVIVDWASTCAPLVQSSLSNPRLHPTQARALDEQNLIAHWQSLHLALLTDFWGRAAELCNTQ